MMADLNNNVKLNESSKQSPTSTDDEKIIKTRVKEILSTKVTGMWSTRLPIEYKERFNEDPPENILELIKSWTDVAMVEFYSIAKLDILYPVKDVLQPPVKATAEIKLVQNKDIRIPKCEPLPLGVKVIVYATFLHDVSFFCVQREDCPIDNISYELTSLARDPVPDEEDLIKGRFVAAMYSSDDSWGRAEILSDKPTKSVIEVLFVDFGMTKDCKTCNIRWISEKLASYPIQSVCCSLNGVQSIKEVDDWPEELLTLIELVKEEPLIVIPHSYTDDGICEVDLFLKKEQSISINQKLIYLGLVRALEIINKDNAYDTENKSVEEKQNAENELKEELMTSKEDHTSQEEDPLLKKFTTSRLVSTKANLEIVQKDASLPLYAVNTFEALNLKEEILKGIYLTGFTSPSYIQQTSLPYLLATPPVNMIAQSQSGTGKTASFVVTMLSRVDITKHYPQCLCLVPTGQLALQIGNSVEQLGQKMTGLKVCYAVREERVGTKRRQKINEHIIIGTPGTVLDSIKFQCFDPIFLKVFVLDEADVMINVQGLSDQTIRIKKMLDADCQMLFFSTTYDDHVMNVAQAIIPDCVIIKLRREEETLHNITQLYIECADNESKYKALSTIYGTISIGQSMIFCATRKTASWLVEQMTKDGYAVGLLTGGLSMERRAAIVNRFREGKEKVLITTYVTARGIDVEQVTMVVNFDLPFAHDKKPDYEAYLHRIGGTGRFGKRGLAINMIDSKRSLCVLKDIEKHFGSTILKLEVNDIREMEKIAAYM